MQICCVVYGVSQNIGGDHAFKSLWWLCAHDVAPLGAHHHNCVVCICPEPLVVPPEWHFVFLNIAVSAPQDCCCCCCCPVSSWCSHRSCGCTPSHFATTNQASEFPPALSVCVYACFCAWIFQRNTVQTLLSVSIFCFVSLDTHQHPARILCCS